MIVISNCKLSHFMKTKKKILEITSVVNDHGYESTYKTYEK
jgi:hypothetical protein